MKPLLADSSAWISYFTKTSDDPLAEAIQRAKKEKRLAICGMIFLEIIRGCRSTKEFGELSEELQSLLWLSVEEAHWGLAGKIGFYMAQKGIHPPATDLLIGAVAIQCQCQLLHRDKHFNQIAKYFPVRLVD